MANELTYQSEFTGQQMDAKFTAVAELQTAITELQAAVNAKYSKPSAGIPSTDLDADVNAALAKANSAIQSLADYYTKAEVDALIATINGQEYVDVSSLPTASASTMGKIYLVGPDGSGYYSYYYTSYDGSAYSWVGPLGTTQISLANYATKAELGQLDQKVDEMIYADEDELYIHAVVDSESKILDAITQDGVEHHFTKHVFGKFEDDEYLKGVIESPEYVKVVLDKDERILAHIDDYDSYTEVHETPHQFKKLILGDSAVIENSDDVAELAKKGAPLFVGENVCLAKPDFATIKIYGILPNPYIANDTVRNDVYIVMNESAVLHCLCDMSVQGKGSAAYPKKGYTLDFLNAEGDALKVKFGDMIAADSFHLKAYMTDVCHCRDIGSAKMWRDMVKLLDYPASKVNNKILDMSTRKTNENFISDAKYSVDGFPVAVFLNDEFYGLYSLKLKKTRENYALDKSDKNQIYLDSITTDAFLDQTFDHADWELKNPKLDGYEEGGEITDAGVLASIEGLFDFLNTIETNYAQHADYIVLQHWLAYIILSEIIGHVDMNGNNTNLITWDKVHWSIIPWDMDLTFGLNPSYGGVSGSMVVLTSDDRFFGSGVFASMRSVYETELKALYKKLRDCGFIDKYNILQYYIRQSAGIPRSVYEADYEKWGTIWLVGYPSIEQLAAFLSSRIDYLDNAWL